MMAMSGSGGFILNAIKIYDDPTASNALMLRRQKRSIMIPEEVASATSQSHSHSQ